MSDPDAVPLLKAFCAMIVDDELVTDDDDGDVVRVRWRDSNDGGTRSRVGGEGADDAFISENVCR